MIVVFITNNISTTDSIREWLGPKPSTKDRPWESIFQKDTNYDKLMM